MTTKTIARAVSDLLDRQVVASVEIAAPMERVFEAISSREVPDGGPIRACSIRVSGRAMFGLAVAGARPACLGGIPTLSKENSSRWIRPANWSTHGTGLCRVLRRGSLIFSIRSRGHSPNGEALGYRDPRGKRQHPCRMADELGQARRNSVASAMICSMAHDEQTAERVRLSCPHSLRVPAVRLRADHDIARKQAAAPRPIHGLHRRQRFRRARWRPGTV
jgi:hypothetical protein